MKCQHSGISAHFDECLDRLDLDVIGRPMTFGKHSSQIMSAVSCCLVSLSGQVSGQTFYIYLLYKKKYKNKGCRGMAVLTPVVTFH